MRKKILSVLVLTALFVSASLVLSAQCPTIAIVATATPSVFCSGTGSQLSAVAQLQGGGYVVTQIPFAPVAGAGTSVILGDDQLSAMFPIGFNFLFFGAIYNQFNICSNGFISFSALNSAMLTPLAMPNTSSPNNIIAGSWEDLYPPGGGSIDYFTTGTAPYRKLIVNIINVPHYPAGNPVTMQYILYETSNEIDIHITSSQNTTPVGEGIENATGTLGAAVPGRNAIVWSATNDAWRFSPGDTVLTYSWSPSAGLSDTAIFNPVATPTASTQYIVTATDTNGCTGSDTIDLLVVNPSVTITSTPDTICAGDNTQLSASVIIASTNNYRVDSIPFAPIAGSGTNVTLGDDEVSGMMPIGFLFSFYGNYYTEFNISSNGFITFDNAASTNNYQGCCAGQLLPNAAHPNNLIAAAWEDYNPQAGGTIQYFNTGIFPNEKLIVQFTNISHAPARDSVTFQIVLCETTNFIEIHTTSMPGNPHGYWYAHTEGIEDAAGLNAITVPGRNSNNTWTATNEAWRFAPTSTVTYAWSPSISLSDSGIYNPVATPATTTTYTLTATDSSGCAGIAIVTIAVNPLPTPPVITFAASQLHSDYATGNQWFLNGVLIAGAVFQDYTPLQIGDYTVTFTDANGCSATSSPYTVTTIGINEIIKADNFSVYPNPVADKFLTISTDKTGVFEFILSDITSRTLMQFSFSNAAIVNTELLAKGIYIYEIKNKSGVVKKGKVEKD